MLALLKKQNKKIKHNTFSLTDVLYTTKICAIFASCMKRSFKWLTKNEHLAHTGQV
jgi:hypothetical protein